MKDFLYGGFVVCFESTPPSAWDLGLLLATFSWLNLHPCHLLRGWSSVERLRMVGFHPSSANRCNWSLAYCAINHSKTMLSVVTMWVIGPNESKSTFTPSMITTLNRFQSLCSLSSSTDLPLREDSSSTVAIPFSDKVPFAPIGLMYFSLTNFLLDSC